MTSDRHSSSPTVNLRDALSSRVLDGISLPVVVIDQDVKVRVFNRAAAALFKRKEKEVLNKQLDTLHPCFTAIVEGDEIAAVLAGEGMRSIKGVELVGENEERRRFDFNIEALVDSKDRIYAATITLVDVTEALAVRAQLTRQNEQLIALHAASTALRQSFDLRKSLFIVVTALTSVPNALFDHAIIFLAENETRVRGTMAARAFDIEHVASIWSLLEGDEPFKRLLMTQFPDIYHEVRKLSRIVRRIRVSQASFETDAIAAAADERRTVTTANAGALKLPARIERALNSPAFLATPIMAESTLLGVLLATSSADSTPISEESIKVVEMLADQAGVAISSGIAYQRINDRAQRDSLTGLYNHGYLMSRMGDEVARAKRYNQTFGVLMIDIDHFKKLNDTHGHQVGDEVLLGLSDLLMHTVRESDICARYGGEEFSIVLPSASFEESEALAERIRSAIEVAVFAKDKEGEPIKITASIGVAAYPEHGQNEENLILKADNALYTAKRQGRNRVSAAK